MSSYNSDHLKKLKKLCTTCEEKEMHFCIELQFIFFLVSCSMFFGRLLIFCNDYYSFITWFRYWNNCTSFFALRHFSNLVSASPHPHQVLDSSINSASILQGFPTSLECTKCIDPIKRGNFWSSYSYIVKITHFPLLLGLFGNVIQMWLQYILCIEDVIKANGIYAYNCIQYVNKRAICIYETRR